MNFLSEFQIRTPLDYYFFFSIRTHAGPVKLIKVSIAYEQMKVSIIRQIAATDITLQRDNSISM